MRVVTNFIRGFCAVLTASGASKFVRSPHATMAQAIRSDWDGVAKDLKRVQTKLKAEAHDGRKKR